MPELTEYCLRFRSGFHLGTRGVNLEETAAHIPSDTLFAAIVDALARCDGAPDVFVRQFPHRDKDGAEQPGAPPFLLTSAFPFAGSVRFFPMPAGLQRWFSKGKLDERRKDIKRIHFVSQKLFLKMLNGEALDKLLFPENEKEEPTTGVALQNGTIWLTAEECEQLPEVMRKHPQTGCDIPLRALRRQSVFVTGQIPRVTVDRVSSASEIFHAGRVTFAPQCGLWFGIHWREPEAMVEQTGRTYRQAFEHALNVLQDDGLGGERSAGYGTFTWQKALASLNLDIPSGNGPALLLSRYHPRSMELPAALNGDGAAYNLIPLGGWLRSWAGAAQRRKRLWLVSEGSVVKAQGAGPWGDVVDVHPTYGNPDGDLPHPVWRYGLALGVAVAFAYEEV
jgi:CRISPR-associated protein Csm4